MADIPASIATFLEGDLIAVAGVARDGRLPANAIFRRLRDTGHRVVPLNPNAEEVEGVRCYPDVLALPETPDGVVVATHPEVSAGVVEQCGERGIRRLWLHRSFGDGSVSEAAVRACEDRGIDCIVGGCPLMFCGQVDVGHRVMRWWLQGRGRVPR